MAFQISGVDAAPFRDLYGLSDEDLAVRGVKRYAVDETPGFPDRIEMRDAAVGETVLLVNYVHQPAETPYRASHAIFIREGAEDKYVVRDEVPDVLRARKLSLRAFDGAHMMVEAALVDGDEVEHAIEGFFRNPAISYIHIHFAARGCFAGLAERA